MAAPLTRRTRALRRAVEAVAESAASLVLAVVLIVFLPNLIFLKLGLPQSGDDNRRVLAVLAYLNG